MNLPVEKKLLIPLLQDLPPVLVHSREEYTVKNYQASFQCWENWVTYHKLATLLADPVSFALFILFRIQQGASYATCKAVFYGVKYMHNLHMVPDPTTQQLPMNML